jgi:clorobiocin biosynthesis protein CloN6
MDQQIASKLGADLLPQHAPSVYEFRQRDDMLFAYVSDRANVTPVYEMPSTARGNGKGSHRG